MTLRIPPAFERETIKRVVESLGNQIITLRQDFRALNNSLKGSVGDINRKLQSVEKKVGTPKLGEVESKMLPLCANVSLIQWGRIIRVKFDKHHFAVRLRVKYYEWYIKAESDVGVTEFDPIDADEVHQSRKNRDTFLLPTAGRYLVCVRAVGRDGTNGALSAFVDGTTSNNLDVTAPTWSDGSGTSVLTSVATDRQGFRWSRKGWVRFSWEEAEDLGDDTTGIKKYQIRHRLSSESGDDDAWKYTTLPNAFISESGSTKTGAVRNLLLENEYQFQIAAFDFSDNSTGFDPASPVTETVTEDVTAPAAVLIFQSSDLGVNTNNWGGARAFETLNVLVSQVASDAQAFKLKYRRTGVGFWTHRKRYEIANLPTSSGGSIYDINVDNLMPGTDYEFSLTVVDWAYNESGESNNGTPLPITTQKPIVAGIDNVTNFVARCYAREKGFWKRQRYWINVSFDTVNPTGANAARGWQIKIARPLITGSGYKYHTINHDDDLDGVAGGGDHVELNIPIPWSPIYEYVADTAEASGFKINVRAVYRSKLGTPLFCASGADWFNADNWIVTGGFTPVVYFSDDTSDMSNDSVSLSLDYSSRVWRYVNLAVPDDFEYPDNYSHTTFHMVVKNTPAPAALADRKRTQIGRTGSMSGKEVTCFVDYWAWDVNLQQRAYISRTQLDNVDYYAIVHVWEIDGVTNKFKVSATPAGTSSAKTGTLPSDDNDPWQYGWLSGGAVAVFEGDHIYTPSSNINWALNYGSSSIFLQFGEVHNFAVDDILMLARNGNKLSNPLTPHADNKMLVVLSTLSKSANVDPWPIGDPRPTYSQGDICVKVGVKSDIYRYCWVDSGSGVNPAFKILEVTANATDITGGDTLAELSREYNTYDGTEPENNLPTGDQTGEPIPPVNFNAASIFMPDTVGPVGGDSGFALSAHGLYIYDEYTAILAESAPLLTPPFYINFATGEATFKAVRNVAGTYISGLTHKIETVADELGKLTAAIEVTGEGKAIQLGNSSIEDITLGNTATGATIALLTAQASIEVTDGDINMNSEGSINMTADSHITLQADADFTASGGSMFFHTGGNLKIGRDSTNYVFDFDVEAEELTIGDSAGTQIIINGDVGDIRSSNFVSGILGQGFFIGEGRIEANDMVLRGALKSSSFVYDEVAVVGGRQFVSPAAPMAQSFTSISDTKLFVDFDAGWIADEWLQIKEGTAFEILRVDSVGNWYDDVSDSAHVVTAIADLTSNGSDFTEDCSDLTGYSESGVGTISVDSSTFPGLDTFKMVTTATNDKTATKDLGSVASDTFKFSVKTYIDSQDDDASLWTNAAYITLWTGETVFQAEFSVNDGGLGIWYDPASVYAVPGVTIVEDTWQEWTFDIDETTPASATCDIYLDGVQVATGVSCDIESSATPGSVKFGSRGANTSYFDYAICGNGFIKDGSVIQDYTTSKFGKSSASFDGDTFLEIPDSDDWYLGVTWTIETQIKITTGSVEYICGQYESSTNYMSLWVASSGTVVTLASNVSGSLSTANFTVPNLRDNAWHHLMIAQNGAGTELRCFVDGVLEDTESSVAIANFLTGDFTVGNHNSSALGIVGNLDEFRITKGVARKVIDFTPPTARYVEDSDTVLLLHFDDGLYTVTRNASVDYISDQSDVTEDCSDLSGYTTVGSGSITAATFDSQSVFKINCSAPNTCDAYDDLGDVSGTNTILSLRLYIESMGAGVSTAENHIAITLNDGASRIWAVWSVRDGGFGFYYGSTYHWVSGITIELGLWTEWTFDIDFSTPATPVCDIYKDRVLVGSSVTCGEANTLVAEGVLDFGADNNVVAYFDWFYWGEDFVYPHTAQVWEKGTAVVSLGVDEDDGFIVLDSQSDNAPYLDIIKRTGDTAYDSYTTQLRLGNLDGITDGRFPNIGGVGLYGDNIYLKGSVYLTDGQDITLEPADTNAASIIFSGLGSLNAKVTGSLIDFLPEDDDTQTLQIGAGSPDRWKKVGIRAKEEASLRTDDAAANSVTVTPASITITTNETGSDINLNPADELQINGTAGASGSGSTITAITVDKGIITAITVS